MKLTNWIGHMTKSSKTPKTVSEALASEERIDPETLARIRAKLKHSVTIRPRRDLPKKEK